MIQPHTLSLKINIKFYFTYQILWFTLKEVLQNNIATIIIKKRIELRVRHLHRQH